LTLDSYIETLREDLPLVCMNADLVRTGIFGSKETCRRFRVQKKGPPYFKVGLRYRYLRDDVLNWVKKQYYYS